MRYHFGEKIRAVRERRSMTLKDVADRAGVSESLVSQIERNRVSPAIDTLLALVDALDIDLEYLFSDFRRERAVHVVRSNERAVFTRPGGVRYERLAQLEGASQGMDGIEAYCITLEEGAKTGSKEYGHRGFELGIILEGSADLTIGNKVYHLEAGDSASFRSEAPHVLANVGTGVLRVLWIITPPKGEIGA
ncbi:MAG TPA: XRE family transcriptional regulator [Termitinemataceae bacterium]|jgi:transcriptional regulator with XRE-family HTH domain|nr:XRE family transcriptional regulator [Termitinemataceae bacterium]HOM22613.1 XRE family transcriptional regulator [Termitinemataceae bacterium]HPP99453.1 XRE family transcriptional regulator [Termitinemataceae bacterium]